MAEQDDAEKTEEPTPRKLEEGRKKGQVANSKEIGSTAILFAAGVAIASFSPFIFGQLYNTFSVFIEKPHELSLDAGTLGDVFADTLLALLIAVGPLMVLFMVLGVVSNLAQSGIIFSGETIIPKLSKLSPIAGAKKLFALKSIVEFLKGIVKISLVGGVATLIFLPEFDRMEIMLQMDTVEILNEIWFLIVKLFAGVVAVMAVIAVVDYLYQRYEFLKQMRMSLKEIKDEFKQAEGDPMIKARLRQLRVERARARMMAAVPNADVVVTNPTHYAVALKYKVGEMAAPVVLAKGVDDVALRIREVANDNDVPIFENPPLARALFAAVELDEEVPEEHYKAVAEVISYVYGLKK